MRCQHPPCTCPATTNSPYCSDRCASRLTGASGRCGCGHPACAPEVAAG